MRLRADQLSSHLSKGLAPLYFISGDETLLLQECCDSIRQACRNQGFNEREVYHSETGFDWTQLLDSANSLSLFGDKKIIELRLPSAKVPDPGKKILKAYCENTNPDTVLLISSPKIEAATQRTAWFKQLEETGITVPLWPLDHHQLPKWINQRLQQAGLKASPDAVNLIADRVEGNLLAAQQEIEKLALVMTGEEITAEMVLSAVADSSRYSVFNLVDRCLEGKLSPALKVLHGLKGEGTEALIILWALLREIRRMISIQDQIAQGQNPERAMQTNGVRSQQQKSYQGALRRIHVKQLHGLLSIADLADKASKGMHHESPWLLLEDMILRLCSQKSLIKL
jgi:DNA polymerase-3 subunit delta